MFSANNFGSGNRVSQTGPIGGDVNNYFGGPPVKEEDVCDILFTVDPRSDRENLRGEKGDRVPGTCEWVPQHETYKAWMSATSSSLWLTGSPGTGKTMIALHVINNLEHQFEGSPDLLLYFFCSYRHRNNNKGDSMLRSLMWQLFRKVPYLQKYAEEALHRSNRESNLASEDTLWKIFHDAISDPRTPQITCVLDGIDEVEGSSRHKLLKKFFALCTGNTNTQLKFRLFVSSRHFVLNGISWKSVRQIQIDEYSIAADIAKYTDHTIQKLATIENFDEIKGDVIKTLQNRCEGTFLWIGLCVQNLEDSNASAIEIKRLIEKMPPGLDAIYESLIQKIEETKRPKAAKFLRWIASAQEPLSLDELAAALEYTPEEPFSAADILKEDLRCCGHLVQIVPCMKASSKPRSSLKNKHFLDLVNSDNYDALIDVFISHDVQSARREHREARTRGEIKSFFAECFDKMFPIPQPLLKNDIIVLVHGSLVDFLTAIPTMSNPSCLPFQFHKKQSHFMVATRCLEYLSQSCLKHGYTHDIGRELKAYLFLRYASFKWTVHMCVAAEESLTLFSTEYTELRHALSSKVLLNWVMSTDVTAGTTAFYPFYRWVVLSGKPLPKGAVWLSLLHVAVLYDLFNLVQGCLEATDSSDRKKEIIFREDITGMSPWRIALVKGKMDMCQTFMRAGVSPTENDFYYILHKKEAYMMYPELMKAVNMRNPSVASKIFFHFIRIMPSKDAISAEHRLKAVKRSLENGFDVESLLEYGFMPNSIFTFLDAVLSILKAQSGLHLKAEEVTQMIFKAGNLPEEVKEISSVRALIYSHPLIDDGGLLYLLKELLSNKPKELLLHFRHTVPKKEFLRACILRAAYDGLVELTTFLWEQGTIMHSLAGDRRNALHLAAGKGHSKVVTFLLDKGLILNDIQNLGAGTLFCAIKNKSLEGVKLLLEKGVNPNCLSRHGHTPLMKAEKVGFQPIIECLLRHHANPNYKDPKGRTAMWYATRYRYVTPPASRFWDRYIKESGDLELIQSLQPWNEFS